MEVVPVGPLLVVCLAGLVVAGPSSGGTRAAASKPFGPGAVPASLGPGGAKPDTQLVNPREARRAAAGAQRAFERTRRRNLPFWDGPTDRCDEIVGRFCLWHESDPAWHPGPERERIRIARAELVETLELYARHAPEDAWIVGQWVRYLIEAGRVAEARAAAGICSAEPWWCAALRGYAHHAIGDYRRAETAYEAALKAMPTELRCSWQDLSWLLEGEILEEYESLGCAARQTLEVAIWLLADPLFLVPGNERRTEHLSRHVLNRLQVGAESPYGVSWGADLEELLLRYGWPESWSRRRQPIYSPGRERPPITGHDPERSFSFLPSSVLPGADGIDGRWELEPQRPREEYLPPYARAFDGDEPAFGHQLAVFRRGKELLLLGAYEWLNDSLPAGTPLRAGLVWAEGTGGPQAKVVADAPVRGVLTARAGTEFSVFGIEVLADSERRAARSRVVRRASSRDNAPALSDILLLEPSREERMPESLGEALSLVRPSITVRSGERIGLLWEYYGMPAGTPLQIEVALTKQGKSFFRRAAEWLGLARSEEATVGMRWREQAEGTSGPAVRYVELRIPELSEGSYVLSASAQPDGGEEAGSIRLIRVRDR